MSFLPEKELEIEAWVLLGVTLDALVSNPWLISGILYYPTFHYNEHQLFIEFHRQLHISQYRSIYSIIPLSQLTAM